MRNYKIVWLDKRESFVSRDMSMTELAEKMPGFATGKENRFVIPADATLDGL